MTVSAHINSLHKKHEKLKKDIKFAYIHHMPDFKITTLKKKKLQVKDELENLTERASNQNTP